MFDAAMDHELYKMLRDAGVDEDKARQVSRAAFEKERKRRAAWGLLDRITSALLYYFALPAAVILLLREIYLFF